jgi:hypothetical protein
MTLQGPAANGLFDSAKGFQTERGSRILPRKLRWFLIVILAILVIILPIRTM